MRRFTEVATELTAEMRGRQARLASHVDDADRFEVPRIGKVSSAQQVPGGRNGRDADQYRGNPARTRHETNASGNSLDRCRSGRWNAAVRHPRMHDDEVHTDADLVRRLLASQHPQWAELPIERVASAGTDNAIYRLGDDLAVRLPRIHWAVDTVAKEQKWLPVLAPHLPLAVPLPVAPGQPEAAFPYPWGVVQWLPGELATLEQLDDHVEAALDLAAFVRALRAIDPAGGPQHRRGLPVRLDDNMARMGIDGLDGELDADAVTEAWNRALAAPDHDGPPVWFHGDLSYLNLLAQDGKITAVIDWGTCGVGDPAIETSIAWSLFPPDAREAYRDALGVDDATWERGKGWVLTGVFGIPYYRDTNPVLVADKVHAIEAVLADSG
jgi:aminoglycoside phosphotransferase (APT) family kinase protein